MPSAGLAISPSRPAPSNWLNQPVATARSVVVWVRWIDEPALARAASRAALRSANGRSM